MRVYLIGHIPKAGETDWRNYIINRIRDFNNLEHTAKFVDIEFLIPQDKDIKELDNNTRRDALATGDRYHMNSCDVGLVNLDLDLGHMLGGLLEMGILINMGKPIILINHHPNMLRTKFIEHNASVTVYNMDDAIDILMHMTR